MTSIDGVVTGLDTTSIIESLLAAERIPQNQLFVQKATVEAQADVFADLRGRYDAIKSAAQNLDLPDDWARLAATSSSELVEVNATTGSMTGEVRFTVLQRAAAHAVYSTDTLSSLDDVVATGDLFSASNYEPLGFSGLAGSGLTAGEQTFEVTQETTAAVTGGDSALPENHTITASNDRVRLRVNGVQRTIDIANGTYATRQDLVDAINVAISNVVDFDGEVTARLGAADEVEFVTTREGSAATIAITGGDGRSDLNLTNDPSDLTGIDGIISVNGVDTTITNTDVGSQVVLDAGTGTITGTFSGGVRLGTADIDNISLGGGTLTEVVTAINSAKGIGTNAAIIKVDDDQYRLQLSADETGEDSAIGLDLGLFTGLTGGFTTLSNGQDAELRVEGINPFTVTSSSDTFTDLMPGLDVTLAGVPTEEVVVNLTRDSETIADRVQALTDAVNDVLEGFDEVTAYDADTNSAALLTGNSTIRRARDELVSALIGPVTGAALGTVSLTGLTITNDGTFTFDRAAFLDTYADDPDAVERVYAAAFESGDDSAVGRVLAEVDDATAFGTGYLRTAEDSANARVEDLDESIASWDRRLELREQVLRATYTRLESALADLQSQSTWLSGQLATLSTPSTTP